MQVDGQPLDFTLTSFNLPIVSRPLARSMKELAGTDLEVLPVELDSHPGYFALNPLLVVECLDEKRTHFLKWKAEDGRPDRVGQYRSVTDLYIESSRVPDRAHVFRVAGWEVALVVSETMRGVMENAGARGAVFTAVT